MKNILKGVFLFCFISMGIMSCSNNDDALSYKNNALSGIWHLTQYGGGFTGQFTSYDKGSVTWNFDTINTTVSIKSKKNYFGPASGSNPYELRQIEDEVILYLNDSVNGRLFVEKNELSFEKALIATFERY